MLSGLGNNEYSKNQNQKPNQTKQNNAKKQITHAMSKKQISTNSFLFSRGREKKKSVVALKIDQDYPN